MGRRASLVFLPPVLACLIVVGTAGAVSYSAAKDARRVAPRWHPHVAEARRYAKRRAGDVAFAVIDQRGRMRGVHMGRTAPMASVFKVMLMAAYLRRRGDRPLSRRGRDLLGPMIRRSDNVAATEVRDMLGQARVERLARAAGMRDFTYHPIWGMSRSSPRDQARFMYRLSSYIPKRHRAYAHHLLAHVVPAQRWGVARVAPRGWKLFFKGGWGSGTGLVDHQVALLKWNRRRRVALAIFTQADPDHTYGKQTLRGVAARLLRGLERDTFGASVGGRRAAARRRR